MEEKLNQRKLPMKTKLGYGCGTACDTIPYILFATYFMFFLTDVAGVPAGIAGTISFVAIIVQTITGPIVAYISDNSTNPKGRRMPILIKSVIPFAITTALLFNPIGGSMGLKVAYYSVLAILFYTFYAAYFNVWTALGAEMTSDYKERNSIRSMVAYIAVPLMLLGSSGTIAMVGLFSARGISYGRSWFYAATALAIIMLLGAFTVVKTVKEVPPSLTEEEKAALKAERLSVKKLIKDYGSFLKLKLYRKIIIFSLLFVVGYLMMDKAIVYMMVNCLGLGEAQQSLFWVMNTVISTACIPLVFGIANKWDKRKAMFLFTAAYLIGLVIWFVFGMVSVVPFVLFVIFCLPVALGTCAFYSLLYSLMYDCCDVYHLATGEQKEGEMLALQNLAQTAGEAIATLLLGWGLQLFGYTGGEAVTPFLQKVIWSFGTIVPGIFIAISMIFLLGYNLTRKDFDEVTQAIADRDEGKEIDMSKFDHLI